MSEATLKLIEAETCAEIANVKTSDDGAALLTRFHKRIARDAAENAYVHCVGHPEAVISRIYEDTLMRLLEGVLETYEANGITDWNFTVAAMDCTGDAFHGRFMELDANASGGTLQ